MSMSHKASVSLSRWIKLLGRCLVALGLLGWLLSGQRGYQVWQMLAQLQTVPFLTACLLYGLAQVLSSWRWQWLARTVTIEARLSWLVRLYFVGMFFNLFLPTSMGGDFVRSWFLARRTQRHELRHAVLSVLSERLNGLIALLVLGCLASLSVVGRLPLWQVAVMWSLALSSILLLVLLPILGKRLVRLANLAQALSISAQQLPVWWRAFLVSLLVQLAAVVQVWLVANALHLHISLAVLAVVVPLVTVASLIPVSIAGLGLREGTLMLLLGPLGVSATEAVSLGLGWLAMQGVTSLVGLPLWLTLPETASLSSQTSPSGEHSQGSRAFRHGEFTHGRLGGDSHQGREGQSAVAA